MGCPLGAFKMSIEFVSNVWGGREAAEIDVGGGREVGMDRYGIFREGRRGLFRSGTIVR